MNNIYNIPGTPSKTFRSDSIIKGAGAGSINFRRDAGFATAFFENQLQEYDPIAFQKIKAKLIALEVFPIKKVSPGADSYSYSMFDNTGVAEYKTSKAAAAPQVDTSQILKNSPLATLTVAYEFSEEDIEASDFARSKSNMPNYNPIFELKNQAMRAILERMDKTCFHGFSPLGLNGIIGNPAITNFAGVPVLWATATPIQILKDLTDAYNSTQNLTLNTLEADTCLMSTELYNQIQLQIFNTYNGATILQVFESQTNVKVIPATELNKAFYANNATGAYGGGVSGFFMYKNDSNCIEHVVANLFQSGRIIELQSGFAYTVPCRAKHGGLIIRQPLTCAVRYQIVQAVAKKEHAMENIQLEINKK